MTGDAPGSRHGWLERVPLHPLLLALFPGLFLWSHNVSEVFTEDVWPVLGSVLAAAVVVWGLLTLAYRDGRRGGAVTGVAAVLLLSYGHVSEAVPPWVGIGIVLLMLTIVAGFAWRAGRRSIGVFTSLANVVSIVLVLTTLPPLLGHAATTVGRGDEARAEVAANFGGEIDGPVRDIYYIVPDRYPREDSAREVFGYDNSDFTRFLEDHGFDVAEQSLANYPKTAHSLAASLNMTYLGELERSTSEAQQDDWGPVYRMLDDHRVGRILSDAGYDYLHVGTWWGPTSRSVHADRILTYDTGSEFARLFRSTTIWPTVQEAVGTDEPTDQRTLLAAFSEHQFDLLDRLAADRGNAPRFVFVHITVPHEPYVFDADGSFVTSEEERSRTRYERFVPHLQYANARLQGFVERVLADRAPDDLPIVVIQSDEGPHPVNRVRSGPGYTWLTAPVADLREKLRILNAYHLPGLDDEAVPEDITPVNTFRLILRHYFGAELPSLPDEVFVFPDEDRLYRFTEVTERVRG